MVLAIGTGRKYVVPRGLFFGTATGRERSAVLKFSDFCKLTYKRSTSIPNQKVFVEKLFKSTGASLQYSPDYYQKLFNGGKALTSDISEQIPNPIQHENVEQFLMQFFDVTHASEAMDKVGIPKSEVNLQAWVAALADQLQIIIHQNEDERETIIASYQAYLNNPEKRDVRYIRTLYRNDGLWVENPPIEQNYQVAFYKKITHTWVIHNMGKVTWKDRCLKCMDEEDVSIRPSKRVIPIQTVEPNKIVKLSVDFDSRGKENKAISVWKMMDANNQDCFPGDTNVLNVVIDVVNTQLLEVQSGRQHS